jgi:hypothetical protein
LVSNSNAALKFDGMRLGLLEKSDTCGEGLFRANFVGTKRKVSYDEGFLGASNDSPGKRNQLLNSDWDGVLFSEEIVSSAIADQKDGYSGLIKE